jgi:hypothetical protein
MGNCSCINKEVNKGEIDLDPERIKELSNYKINFNLAQKLKKNPKLFLILKKFQARMRGLITRNKVRSIMSHRNHEHLSKYTTIHNSKIVRFFLNLDTRRN